MAIPTQPTATTICTEAWKLFGKASPSSAEITRATDYGMEMVKSDIKDMGLEWGFLRTIAYKPITANVSKVQLPTDFAKMLKVQILKGDNSGTAQAGANTTITLASTFGESQSETEGKLIVITGGTGSEQARQIKSFNTSTKVATIDEDWTTNPDATSTYVVVDSHEDCDYHNVFELDEIRSPHIGGIPKISYHQQDTAEGDLYFDVAPDDDFTYVAKIRYYANIQKIDITVDKYNMMLRLLNGLFIQGVFVWALQDDTRYTVELQKYRDKLNRAAGLYLYPNQVPDSGSILDYQ